MLAYVEVATEEVEERSGRNERGFWSMRNQQGYLHQGAPYPEPFTLRLEDTQIPYKPGKYLLAAGSFQRGKFGLEVSRSINLIPISDAIAKLNDLTRASVRPAAAA